MTSTHPVIMTGDADDQSSGSVYTFDQLIAQNTGSSIDPEIWHAAQRRNGILERQTNDLVAKLETSGIEVISRNSHTFMVGEITGCAEPIPAMRRVRFLPKVAQSERAPMLNNLRGFVREFPQAPYLRYMVITAGERIPLYGPLRETITHFQRRISKWASKAMARYDIAVVFRGTEFTIDDDLTFHVHANILLAPLRKLPPEEWADFLHWCWEFFGSHLQDNGRLQNPDEVIKYSFKPTETHRLGANAAAWLYEQTRRLKLVQPMGAFADYCRTLEENGEKHAYIHTPRGKTLTRVKKQTRPKQSDTEKSPPTSVGTPIENQIIARTAPLSRFTPYAEPCLIVNNYTPAPTTETGKLNLWKIQQAGTNSRTFWDTNGAPSPEIAHQSAGRKTSPDDTP